MKEYTTKASGNVNIQAWFDKGLANEAVIASAVKGARKWAEIVRSEADKNAPRDTGTLARSICVTIGGEPNANDVFSQAENGNAKVKFKQGTDGNIYISANTPYAHKQHEKHERKSKYLERAFNAHINEAELMIGNQIADTLLKEKYSDEAVFRRKFPDLKYEDYKDLL